MSGIDMLKRVRNTSDPFTWWQKLYKINASTNYWKFGYWQGRISWDSDAIVLMHGWYFFMQHMIMHKSTNLEAKTTVSIEQINVSLMKGQKKLCVQITITLHNIKIWGPSQHKDASSYLTNITILVIKVRQSSKQLILIMWIYIPGKMVFILKQRPRYVYIVKNMHLFLQQTCLCVVSVVQNRQ